MIIFDRQFLQFILISLVGINVSARSLIWEEAGVTGENPRFQAGDRRTLSHTNTLDHAD